MARVDGHLLNVALVDNIEQQVAEWNIVFVGRNPRSSLPDVWKEIAIRARLVIRYGIHAEFPEKFTRVALYVTQPWQGASPSGRRFRERPGDILVWPFLLFRRTLGLVGLLRNSAAVGRSSDSGTRAAMARFER